LRLDLRVSDFHQTMGSPATDDLSLRPFDRLLARPVPDFLYHYTSAYGLCGIVQSDTIWASKIQYLNDSTELLLAIQICEKLLHDASDRQADEWSKTVILSVAESLKRVKHINICVCSFSQNKDQLSQWRGYCPHEGGYSLGIPSKHLVNALASQKFTLVPCVYDSILQTELVQDAVEIVLPSLLRIPNSTDKKMDTAIAPLVVDLHSMLWEIAPVIKNSNFSEECEWRGVSGPIDIRHERVKLRAQGNLLRPYYEIPLNLIETNIDIVPGPCRYPDLARDSCYMLAAKAGLTSFAVSESAIPFRVV
jgi:Protein of unknown function (DUF2971)